MCPMCMTTIAATVVGLGSAGSITAFVATKLRSSIREQDPPKTDRSTLSVDTDQLARPAGERREE